MNPLGYSGSTIAILILFLYAGFVIGAEVGSQARMNETYHESKLELEQDLNKSRHNVTEIESDLSRSIAVPAFDGMVRSTMTGYEFGYDWPSLSLPLALMPLFGIVYFGYRRLVSLIS